MTDAARPLLQFFSDKKQVAGLEEAADALGLHFDNVLALAKGLEREGLIKQDDLVFDYVITLKAWR